MVPNGRPGWVLVATSLLVVSLLIGPASSTAPGNHPAGGSPAVGFVEDFAPSFSSRYSPPSVEGNVSVGPPGGNPRPVTVDNRTGLVFVGLDPGLVDVISPETNRVLAVINLGTNQSPLAMAFDNVTGQAFVTTAANQVDAISATSFTLVARIPVGTDPAGIAYDELDGNLYVANFGSTSLSVINGSTDRLISTFGSPMPFPDAITYDSDTNELVIVGEDGYNPWGYASAIYPSNHTQAWTWVPNQLIGQASYGPFQITCDPTTDGLYITWIPASGRPSLLVLDGMDGAVITNISIANSSTEAVPSVWGVAYDPVSQLVYVADPDSNSLTLIRPSNESLVTTVSTGAYPYEPAFDGFAGDVYVSNTQSQSVTVVNATTNRAFENVTLAAAPVASTYDSVQGVVFTVGADAIYEVSTANRTLLRTASLGFPAQGVAFDSRTNQIYVTNPDNGTVTVLSAVTLSPVATIPVGATPLGVAYDNSTGLVYVACWGAGAVYSISGASRSVIGRTEVGSTPSAVVVDSTDRELFVTNLDNDSVSIVSETSLTVLATVYLPFLSSPAGLSYDGATNDLFVADRDSGNISVISAISQSVVRTIHLGGTPFGVLYVSRANQVLVSNLGGSNVTVLNASSGQVLGSLIVGSSPIALTYDPSTSSVYVANYYSGNLSVLQYPPVDYRVSWSETGLPPSIAWSVVFDGTRENGTAGSPLIWQEPNGTYNYSISNVPGWHQTTLPVTGLATVSGAELTEPALAYSRTMYSVTFSETGLPAGASWSVTFNGTTLSATESSIPFSVPNGTYAYKVTVPSSQLVNPSNGGVNVSGANQTVALTVSKIPTSGNGWWFWGTLGVVAAAGGSGLLVVLVRHRRPPGASSTARSRL
jgi:YVTN family beta-propeller protein